MDELAEGRAGQSVEFAEDAKLIDNRLGMLVGTDKNAQGTTNATNFHAGMDRGEEFSSLDDVFGGKKATENILDEIGFGQAEFLTTEPEDEPEDEYENEDPEGGIEMNQIGGDLTEQEIKAAFKSMEIETKNQRNEMMNPYMGSAGIATESAEGGTELFHEDTSDLEDESLPYPSGSGDEYDEERGAKRQVYKDPKDKSQIKKSFHRERPLKIKYLFKNILLIGPGYESITPICIIIFALVVCYFSTKVIGCEESQGFSKLVKFTIAWIVISIGWTAFTNPGHLRRKLSPKEYHKHIVNGDFSCATCMTLKTDEVFHCEECGVCVKGYDHHCIVMGNCIGRYNLIPFYAMLFFSVAGICCVYIVTILGLARCYSAKS